MAGLPTFVLTPILLVQAVWVAARAMRLPEADGPRNGRSGGGPLLRVLILGDSSAAGVGAAHQDAALAGRLVAHLHSDYDVQWALWAQSGLTTSGMLRMLNTQPAHDFDVAVIALGVNDTKNGMHPTRWNANYVKLLQQLRRRHGVRRIYASGVPPLGAFPFLPRPLRNVLGARAARFDTILADLCADQDGVEHLPFDLPLEPGLMAADGFHPAAQVYDIWAMRIADALRANPPVALGTAAAVKTP
ncbi:SGNH/GDSL hydrolase family protein [uncultured Tateyamaria sp.]|uniref:SGNH/GDSL hydrolase family protein n=1 Tax=uncultured Tateyamaria sp. TaxID=455651 RepID=UPI0026145C8A|nr:SGNH/GDSL hydrolase family protein [uncultured Tateyamaria sp.]